MYGKSGSIRDALKAWDGKREDVYVLTKCTSFEFLECYRIDG